MKRTTSATKILCRHLLKQREARIDLLEQFVKAWDAYEERRINGLSDEIA